VSLEIVALVMVSIHFTAPLTYYGYLRSYLNKPWEIRVDTDFEPNVSVIIPTFNEASVVQQRLENVKSQSYPTNKMSLIVVDSASTDGTVQAVKEWAERNTEVNVRLITEPVRRGKVHALNLALSEITKHSEVVIFTDADCLWMPNSVKEAVKYFADGQIGAVTCTIYPINVSGPGPSFDKTYRNFNNVIRLAESKAWSTPIGHGPLIAYRTACLNEIGGVPDSGADDSTPFTLAASKGYRSIQAPDVLAYEFAPNSLFDNLVRRLRRAHHLISHFWKVRRLLFKENLSKRFRSILAVETYLHIANPWLLFAGGVLLLAGGLTRTLNLLPLAALTLAALLVVAVPAFRAWVLTQVLLMIAAVSYVYKGELRIWNPIKSARQVTAPPSTEIDA
jgi:biofilm PGA synthesis N-glycosyltransferase PgaC